MLELRGKYNTAKVFTDVIDDATISQITTLLNQQFVEGSKIRIMPDIHAGAGCVIGTTMTITDKIVPNLVGVDIGCGMYIIELEERNIDFQKLDDIIRCYIPLGFNIHENPVKNKNAESVVYDLHCVEHIDAPRAIQSVGTLGGGNHFIEVDRDDNGKLYLVIHSGSRNLGMKMAKYYQQKAIDAIRKQSNKESVKVVVEKLKAEGRECEIEQRIRELNASSKIPDDLAYLSGIDMQMYLEDMDKAQQYAMFNRIAMGEAILKNMKLTSTGCFHTIHNYIDVKEGILRKGSVSAQSGERLLIPINMKDGSLLCTGKGNPDWNFSAPHGAGRLLSRSAAKETLSLEEFQETMKGIFSTSVSQSTLDEAPMAYKSIDSIIGNIGDTVTVEKILKPVYNLKA